MAEDFLLSSSVSKNFYFMIKKSAQKEKKRHLHRILTNYKLQTSNRIILVGKSVQQNPWLFLNIKIFLNDIGQTQPNTRLKNQDGQSLHYWFDLGL